MSIVLSIRIKHIFFGRIYHSTHNILSTVKHELYFKTEKDYSPSTLHLLHCRQEKRRGKIQLWVRGIINVENSPSQWIRVTEVRKWQTQEWKLRMSPMPWAIMLQTIRTTEYCWNYAHSRAKTHAHTLWRTTQAEFLNLRMKETFPWQISPHPEH